MRRKLFCCVISMIIGICLSLMGLNVQVIFLLFLAVILLKQKKIIVVLLLFSLLGAVFVYLAQWEMNRSWLNQYVNQKIEITGVVTSIKEKEPDHYQLICKVSGSKLLVNVHQQLSNYPNLVGKQIGFTAKVERPKPAGNPRTFDYRLYLKSKNIHFVASTAQIDVVNEYKTIIHQIQSFLLMKKEEFFLSLRLSTESKSFLRGVLFGDTMQLDEAVYEEFQVNGTAHVLAVSGLHVGILYSVFRWIDKRKKSKWIAMGFILFLLAYGTISLWSVSVTRAIMMILLMLLGQKTHRRYDMITALSAAALCALINNPLVVLGAGFQMSFLAVLAIGFIKPWLMQYMNSGVAMALSVQIGLMPYIAYQFNYISIMGILCNVFIVFLVSIIVPLGIGIFFLFFFDGIQIPILERILEAVAKLTVELNHMFAAGGVFYQEVISPPLWTIFLIYGLMFLLTSEHVYVLWNRKLRQELSLLLLLLICAASVIGFWEATPFDRAQIVFLDVGQGDCVQLKGEQNVLIDGGGNIRYDVGKKTLKPYLLKNGIKQIDLAAATHLHTDHYLGLQQLEDCFTVKNMLTEGKAGQRINLEKDAWIDILWPENRNPDTEDENVNSLIFSIKLNGVTTLVTGDITEEGERALLGKYQGTGALKADILKVAHHGSKYSTTQDFLDEVNPKIAVISVGKNNYGHPSDDVIEKLVKKGIMIYRTDISGAIGMICDRGKISVCTKNQ
ncbi:competence protein ComEC [Clostridiales Family XIII bacterium PM5-7]